MKIPLKSFENATNLKLLDLQNNQMNTIDLQFIEKIKNGTDIYFEGKNKE